LSSGVEKPTVDVQTERWIERFDGNGRLLLVGRNAVGLQRTNVRPDDAQVGGGNAGANARRRGRDQHWLAEQA